MIITASDINYYEITSELNKLRTNELNEEKNAQKRIKDYKCTFHEFLAKFLKIDMKEFPPALRPIVTGKWNGRSPAESQFILHPNIKINIEKINRSSLCSELNEKFFKSIREDISKRIQSYATEFAIKSFFIIDIKTNIPPDRQGDKRNKHGDQNDKLENQMSTLQAEILKLLTLSKETKVEAKIYREAGVVLDGKVYNFATLPNLFVTASPKMVIIIRDRDLKDKFVLYFVLEAAIFIFISLKITNEILEGIADCEINIIDLFNELQPKEKSQRKKNPKKNKNNNETVMEQMMALIKQLKDYRQLSSILMCLHMSYVTSSYAGEFFYSQLKKWTGLSNLLDSLHYKLENSHYLLTYLMDYYQFSEISKFQ